jgi:hypothetical protein
MGKGWGSRSSVPEQGRDMARVESGATGTGQSVRRLVGSLILVVSAFTGLGAIAVVAAAPAFAAGAPTVAAGFGAFGNSPVVNLTGCTGTTSSTTLTCTNNPITAGVTVGMGAYGVDLDSTTPNSVTSVTATTIVLSADPSAAVTATATQTFTGTQAIGNANDATLSTTVTDTGNFADYGMVAGLEVYGAGIAPQTTVVSVSTTNMVLSQAPTAALSGTTLFFNAPDVNNVLTQVSGGAANVNTSSLAVVSQPPAADGYITTSTTSTTGIVNMYQALNPVDSTFSATGTARRSSRTTSWPRARRWASRSSRSSRPRTSTRATPRPTSSPARPRRGRRSP